MGCGDGEGPAGRVRDGGEAVCVDAVISDRLHGVEFFCDGGVVNQGNAFAAQIGGFCSFLVFFGIFRDWRFMGAV